MRVFTALAAAFILSGFSHCSADDVAPDSIGFENELPDAVPGGWRPFHRTSRPDVKVVRGGAFGSHQSLKGVCSDSGGWTALSKEFHTPLKRVMIEFTFAFSDSRGRSLNVWTHEPTGTDASQLNLCIQNGSLMQYDGRTRSWETITRKIVPTKDPTKPVWHRLRAIIGAESTGVDYWISNPNSQHLPESNPITMAAYRTNLPISAVDMVSGTRIASGAWYLVDDLKITSGDTVPNAHEPEPLPETVRFWTGPPIPVDPAEIPFAAELQHSTIHRATADGYKFLHGAAIVAHRGIMYSNWANSPNHENGPLETLQGRRSIDDGQTWSGIEVIGPGFKTNERHSHGILFVHQDEVWTICSRFGIGEAGTRFPGLQGEAFVLNNQTRRWDSRGIVMKNCWPYDEPVRTADGNFITGGQDKDGLPVVAISHGDNLLKWDSVLIPFDRRLKPSYAETTVWAEGNLVTAVIRGGAGVAWIAKSKNGGRSWSPAAPSNLPMPRAKAYLGKLSTGQLYLVSNLRNRDTLVVSVSRPGESTLSRMWRVRHGKSIPPRFNGRAKGKQWSYPYGYEYEGKLFVVYSVGKEDCGLTTMPIDSLRHNEQLKP